MTRLAPGDRLDLLVGLGNGFDVSKSGEAPLLIGGGVGLPPLYRLCEDLTAQCKAVQVIMGFNTKSEIFYRQEFEALGAKVLVTTADGTAGQKGLVTDGMAGLAYSYFYACGPLPMLRAIEGVAQTGGQYSFEERMGCGFGACMGCTCQTRQGPRRVCREGPVLLREDVVW